MIVNLVGIEKWMSRLLLLKHQVLERNIKQNESKQKNMAIRLGPNYFA